MLVSLIGTVFIFIFIVSLIVATLKLREAVRNVPEMGDDEDAP